MACGYCTFWYNRSRPHTGHSTMGVLRRQWSRSRCQKWTGACCGQLPAGRACPDWQRTLHDHGINSTVTATTSRTRHGHSTVPNRSQLHYIASSLRAMHGLSPHHLGYNPTGAWVAADGGTVAQHVTNMQLHILSRRGCKALQSPRGLDISISPARTAARGKKKIQFHPSFLFTAPPRPEPPPIA